ncbi:MULTISPECIES: nucleotidyl transferase AbiEii/AbiGii toxin family protein [Mycobacterium]|uniref:Uncharacterized protein n=1 Tax=Mycobacterium persicum TaxID=1487726 RepID=A0AB38UQ35_9MYCO|nr:MULTISPECIES: nucleotidyl transferase AbiEii/AbiGii toxin family protein [Mycobacterium]VAZ73305.1 hypothetical protein LAUMK15_01734 [Mycobacterium persicum]VAZ82779.1 hypothetical protein LAUMK42_01589 [Mycobacterium persicum]VAZ90320.1 hypothetical protein LAUMK4_01370 [Mycobacterium persicum]
MGREPAPRRATAASPLACRADPIPTAGAARRLPCAAFDSASIPGLPAFAASKTARWADRLAPRDLWDLWALSRLGAIDATAAELFRRYGPTDKPPAPHLFNRAASDADWQSQRAGQTRLSISAVEALTAVREAWRQALLPTGTLINDE